MPRSPEWSGDMSKNGMTIGSIIVKFRQCSWGSVTCETKSWSSFHTLSENMSGLGISVTCLCDKPLWGPFIIYCQINKRYFGSQKILLHLKKKRGMCQGCQKITTSLPKWISLKMLTTLIMLIREILLAFLTP